MPSRVELRENNTEILLADRNTTERPLRIPGMSSSQSFSPSLRRRQSHAHFPILSRGIHNIRVLSPEERRECETTRVTLLRTYLGQRSQSIPFLSKAYPMPIAFYPAAPPAQPAQLPRFWAEGLVGQPGQLDKLASGIWLVSGSLYI